MKNEVEKSYEILKKKYNLPDFKYLENEYDLYTIDSSDYLLKNIRKKIIEKIEILVKVVGGVLEPEPSFNEIYESKEISESDKKDLFEIYKKLMYYYKHSIHLIILEDEKKDAEFINAFNKDWPILKKSISEFMLILENAWIKDIDSDDDLRYLG